MMIQMRRFTAWSMWLMGAVFYAYQYILRVSPSIMMDDLMGRFHMDSARFGQFCGVYYIGYALFHLPLGIALDKLGPRKVLSACIALSVLGTLPMVMAKVWVWPTLGRFLMGVGSSAAILGSFKIIRMGFEEKHFTRMLSLCVTIGLVGAIYGGGPVAYLCKVFGYEMVVRALCLVGIALAILTYALVPTTLKSTAVTSSWQQILSLTRNKRVMAVCFFAGLMVGPLEGFADVWGSAFLKKVYGFSETSAASVPSLIFVGMCFGAPFLSALATKMRSDLGVITLSGMLMLGVFGLLITGLMPVLGISVGFVLVGIACAYQILAIYKASTYVEEDAVGLTTALANMVIMGFGYAFHAAIGSTIALASPLGEKAAFLCGVSVIVVALLAGTMGFTCLLWQDRRVLARAA